MYTQYRELFSKNPIKTSEPMGHYYERLLNKAGFKTSERTLQRYYKQYTEELSKLTNKAKQDLKVVEKQLVNKKIPNMHIILPDVHIPFQNDDILLGISNLIEDHKESIKGFHIAGDFLDMLGFNTHQKDEVPIKGYSLGIEYEIGNSWLDILTEKLLPGTQKNYLFGNHEARYNNYLKNVNNSVQRDVIIGPKDGLHLINRGFKVLGDWKEDSIQIGKLAIIHGFYLNQNCVKTHMNKLRSNVAFGHTHRISSLYEGDHAGFNMGFLGDKDSIGFKYASKFERASWQNGFGIVFEEPNGDFHFNQIVCINNSFYFGGKKYGK